MNEANSIIETRIIKGRTPDFLTKRTARINEAINFSEGTFENPTKNIISLLPNGKETYFLKPGKETRRLVPNIYDMSPNVGVNGNSETEGWEFQKIWEYLIKISIINQITFKKVLVILYRNCFLLDNTDIGSGIIRYLPSEELLKYINNLNDYALVDGFKDKFNTNEIGLLEYLHFIDLLAWNEDVKYHVYEGKPDFVQRNKNVGRVNTVLSVISAPLMISNFILDIIHKTEQKGIIDVNLITSTIQMFSRSRGICVLTNKDLLEHLSPYLTV